MTSEQAVEILDKSSDGELFTARSFLAYLRLSEDHWFDPAQQGSIENDWVFRGHEDAQWQLIASAARPEGAFWEFAQTFKMRVPHTFPAVSSEKPGWSGLSEGLQQQVLLTHAHAVGLREFCELARSLHFPISLPPRLPSGTNNLVLSHDERPYDPWIDRLLATQRNGYFDSDAVALAQHHGIPTFLLDWTENPIVAAFFGLGQESDEQKSDMCV